MRLSNHSAGHDLLHGDSIPECVKLLDHAVTGWVNRKITIN
ncbi:hypothetical protein SAMN05421881_10347 [Nitrosomonas halophila]|uniref:Uncharacterized protein n=1 Tax=Nitrosomonas halophila TaxID=44576 RepID=A0A1H3JLY4_9PROT|nr:hypothetical protein SAMN05421881_10347 [Nitrosomonas halophila]